MDFSGELTCVWCVIPAIGRPGAMCQLSFTKEECFSALEMCQHFLCILWISWNKFAIVLGLWLRDSVPLSISNWLPAHWLMQTHFSHDTALWSILFHTRTFIRSTYLGDFSLSFLHVKIQMWFFSWGGNLSVQKVRTTTSNIWCSSLRSGCLLSMDVICCGRCSSSFGPIFRVLTVYLGSLGTLVLYCSKWFAFT